MNEPRTGWYCITGQGEALMASDAAHARELAAEHNGMPVIFVHADDIAAFKAS